MSNNLENLSDIIDESISKNGIIIGDYRITEFGEKTGSVWIEKISTGEGMGWKLKGIENLMDKFWNENF